MKKNCYKCKLIKEINNFSKDKSRKDGFNLSDPIEQQVCFNYKNLQPLWAKENLSKGGIKCNN